MSVKRYYAPAIEAMEDGTLVLATDYDALAIELEVQEKTSVSVMVELQQTIKERDALAKRLEEAERDAARYRWVRTHGAWESEAWLSSATPEQIDDSIDVEMARP